MWIVGLALRRPYTFVVVALLIVLLGAVTIVRMPTDIFPDVAIPVVSVIWSLTGTSVDDMEARILTTTERAFTTTVNDIEHIESQSMPGVGVIKVYFQPNARIEAAIAQITAVSQTLLRTMPTGTTPPLILQYSASRVPILQLSIGSTTLTEGQLFDYAQNFIRTQLATVQGASVTLPYGGKPRQVMVDLDPKALQGKGLSAADVVAAVSAQNLVLPTGTVKIGSREYPVLLNSSPDSVAALNDLPIKRVNGSVVYVRDVAQVRDGFAVQQNIVATDGQRGSLLSILKGEGASTLAIVARVKAALPAIQATLPPELEIKPLFDQSIFVRAALDGVIREAVIAGALTGIMILVFLGSWRSTLIVAVSIPLSILTSLIVLGGLGYTINIMTLGGLGLAVGILVDDATVEIENIHRNLGLGTPLRQAILDGARQIATPAFVSTLAICIVFVPVIFLKGIVLFLFTPLALAVVVAMLASYLLSRTLVPTMVDVLLGAEVARYAPGATHGAGGDVFWRVHGAFNRRFERFRDRYGDALAWALRHRPVVLGGFGGVFALSLGLAAFSGQDFFPQVDAGQFRLHVRAPASTRLEATDQLFNAVEERIRRTIPPEEIGLVLRNVGLPAGGVNLAFGDSATVGSADGEILVALREPGATFAYVRELRRTLPAEFPDTTFFFSPADIVSQTLDFGLPAPIDVQVVGAHPGNEAIARRIAQRITPVPGVVDVHVHQVTAAPALRVNVDRTRAAQLGLTQRDIASSVLVSLAGSGDGTPNFWLDPKNGVNYRVAVQTPPYRVDSVEALQSEPLVAASEAGPQLLTNVAAVDRGTTPAVTNHYNVQRVFDVFASVQDRDLGGAARDIQRIVADEQQNLPRGSSLVMRGQVESMRAAFSGLGAGMIFAIVLVYALMVVNFQSWLDPFIIITALPGAIAGVLWALFVTQTTINVPSLMGAIMSIGVATSNSILLVTFANDERRAGRDALSAALSAGSTRLRPVLMTALAMIIGMLPMALGLGEGGEQNAPLGRAVIGGQARATLAHNEATQQFNGITLRRWRELRAKELVAQQDVDGYAAAYDTSRADANAARANVDALQASVIAAEANVVANEANVRRLTDLQSFQTLRAPFAGVVTVRNVDPGALISSGSAATQTPAFRIAQIDAIRIYVNVPQTFVTSIAPGLSTDTVVRELPGRVFKARVFSTAEALDPASRTLLTEIRMRNEGGALRPGMYADVQFHVARADPPWLVPSTAIIIRSGPPQIAVVRADGVVRLQPVQLARDLGPDVEVTGGLGERDTFVLVPAGNLQDGARVHPVPRPA